MGPARVLGTWLPYQLVMSLPVRLRKAPGRKHPLSMWLMGSTSHPNSIVDSGQGHHTPIALVSVS